MTSCEFLGERRDIPISNVSRTDLSGRWGAQPNVIAHSAPLGRTLLTSILCGWCPVKHISRFIWIARPHTSRLACRKAEGDLTRVPAPPRAPKLLSRLVERRSLPLRRFANQYAKNHNKRRCPNCPKSKPWSAASARSSRGGRSSRWYVVAARCRPISIRPRFETSRQTPQGAAHDGVRRLGKRIVLCVSDDSAVVIEPRMTGLMLLSDPPDRVHLRIEWKFAGQGEIQLGLVLGSTRPGNRPPVRSRRAGTHPLLRHLGAGRPGDVA